VFGPDKKEVTEERRILAGVNGIDPEHVDGISLVQSRSGECFHKKHKEPLA
jgi:hypothetical protein